MTRGVSDADEHVADCMWGEYLQVGKLFGAASPHSKLTRMRPGDEDCRRLAGGEHEEETSERFRTQCLSPHEERGSKRCKWFMSAALAWMSTKRPWESVSS